MAVDSIPTMLTIALRERAYFDFISFFEVLFFTLETVVGDFQRIFNGFFVFDNTKLPLRKKFYFISILVCWNRDFYTKEIFIF